MDKLISYTKVTSSFIRSHFIIAGAAGILVVGGALFAMNNSGEGEQTLAIRAADFLQQISVSGTVVAPEDADLGFTQSGRVAGVYAKVGDRVFRGSVLASLENGDLRALVLQKEAALETEEATLASLVQGLRPEEIAISESQVEMDRASLEQANQGVINALRSAYTKVDDAIRNKTDQMMENPRSANPQLLFVATDQSAEEKLESTRVSLEHMLIEWERAISELSEVHLAAASIQGKTNLETSIAFLSLANTVLNKSTTNQQVTFASLAEWTIDVATARTNLNTAMDTLTSAITTQKNAEATLEKDERKLVLDRAGSSKTNIDGQRARVKAAKADLESAQAQLRKTFIVAPFNGIVTKMDIKQGEIVTSGISPVAMMGEGTLEIEGYVPEVNVALLKTLNPASITLDAYGPNVAFTGKVISVDPARTVRDGVSAYKVMLRFDGADARIRSGMTANIVITTEERQNVLSVPQGIVTLRDGKKFVTILRENDPFEQEVTTGLVSSLGNIEILSGLDGGDIVVLPKEK
ncbi:MAG: efflux RND transporter periplasmic adaptor subunit [Parcubacteria group bacterium]|nr:efflux RND transporter periplasmic adaptor subunit [Parcubacteria group bacterium]